MLPFNYYGGKGALLEWLIPLLPKSQTYVEACAGSAAVFFNKPRSQYNVINDVNNRIYNLFRVARDRTDELLHALELTVPHISEYMAVDFQTDDEVELARQTLVAILLGRHSVDKLPVASSFNTMYGRIDQGGRNDFLNVAINRLKRVGKDLRGARILCQPVAQLLDKVNGKPYDILIYIDPPYVPSSRVSPEMYAVEMTEADHSEMLDLCLASPHKVAISGYDNPLYAERLNGWAKHTKAAFTIHDNKKSDRVECLWCNYDAPQRGLEL